MTYEDLIFKIPQESKTYREDSAFVVKQIISILDTRKNIGDDKIILNTNLRLGLPLENINKIAGSMIEAWAFEIFGGHLSRESEQLMLKMRTSCLLSFLLNIEFIRNVTR